MSNKWRFLRDPFTFSLRGMTATASFFITPVLGDDRINRAWDEKLSAKCRAPDENGAAPRTPLAQPVTQQAGQM